MRGHQYNHVVLDNREETNERHVQSKISLYRVTIHTEKEAVSFSTSTFHAREVFVPPNKHKIYIFTKTLHRIKLPTSTNTEQNTDKFTSSLKKYKQETQELSLHQYKRDLPNNNKKRQLNTTNGY